MSYANFSSPLAQSQTLSPLSQPQAARARPCPSSCPPGQTIRRHGDLCWCSQLVPGTTSVERLTGNMTPNSAGISGLSGPLDETLSTVINLGVLALAVYGGYKLFMDK